MEKESKKEEQRRKVLITSALPYVNNVPHLGNLIGCVLSADVYARFCRLRGQEVLYVCGTDEYGTATEIKALQEKTTPKELCDRYYALHCKIYEWFNISFDCFGRTTNKEHESIAQTIFKQLDEKKLLLEKDVQQLYCKACARFLSDRFVYGECPKCHAKEARGDQCEKCEYILGSAELIAPKCKLCDNSPEVKTSRHLFLDLPKLNPELQTFFRAQQDSKIWTHNALQITDAWLRDGVKARCITRDLKWGTPVPKEGYRDKVFYVWFDAPIGYISITAQHLGPDKWQNWWQRPDQVELVQFMGKDNIPFHSIIFPATLLGTDAGRWTMVKQINACEYLEYQGAKFSKTHKTGVFGDDAMQSGIPSDYWRFYLLHNRPETKDSTFQWKAFEHAINGELIAILGNYCHRILSFIAAKYDHGEVPYIGKDQELDAQDKNFIVKVEKELVGYIQDMEAGSLRQGLVHMLDVARHGHAYYHEKAPWRCLKKEPEKAAITVSLCVHLIPLLITVSEPFMPDFSIKMQAQLGVPRCRVLPIRFNYNILGGHRLPGRPEPVFAKLPSELLQQLEAKHSGL